MIDLVIYNEKYNELKLFRLDIPPYQKGQWLGEPFSAWISLEIALSFGWEVVGEL